MDSSHVDDALVISKKCRKLVFSSAEFNALPVFENNPNA